MANLGESYNVNDAPEIEYQPIPAGVYTAIIEDSEKKLSKSRNNYLNLKIRIVEGQYKDRYVWDILNLWHSNEKVKNIARGTLGKIQEAVNVPDVSDSSMLHNKPMKVKLAIQPDEGYGPKNTVKGYKPVAGNPAPAPATAPAPQTEQKPWEAADDDDW
jgi:hypothetical protein